MPYCQRAECFSARVNKLYHIVDRSPAVAHTVAAVVRTLRTAVAGHTVAVELGLVVGCKTVAHRAAAHTIAARTVAGCKAVDRRTAGRMAVAADFRMGSIGYFHPDSRRCTVALTR